ncbi:uncharacterized protein GGS22DRAFT_130300 [Annulohypoxylon maeteangense]|uniref:uncharacterized protein n=1 Tax=Annulohypoxylon maeteangense TaxID=1927788 RepID=UPI0020071EE3|nr:uncharacterized protein GGS22DRAFT_130300 [Annulohypoxylon maeteangense]KAI0885530.1 hypothetical protein GGS22DRAFT_130300 [Annulohypoxylon maeteangense]
MEAPAPIKDLQNEIASMIPRVLGDCVDIKIKYLRRGAGEVPHHLFWAKVDPHGLMSRDKRLWKAAQLDMQVPTITIDYTKLDKSQLTLEGDGWELVEEEMGKIINKYTQMFFNRGKNYEPWRGLDPRLILFKFRPYNLTIGPTCARARIPPRCSQGYKMFLGIDDVQVLTYKTMLHLDNPYDPNRGPWEREWIEWNGDLAEKEARESKGLESRHGHGRSGGECVVS